MSFYRAICRKLLQRDPDKLDLCCICFKTFDVGNPIDDEIQIKMNSGSLIIRKLSSVLESLLGQTFHQLSYMLKTICNCCKEQAIISYNFLNTSKENANILFNAVGTIDRCLKDIPEDLYKCNTLYITIEPNILETYSVIRRCYDNQTHNDLTSVLERIKTIIDSQDNTVVDDHNLKNVNNDDPEDLIESSNVQEETASENKFIDIVIESKVDDTKLFNFRCALCNAGFNDLELYNRHMSQKRNCKTRGRGLFKCVECDYKSPYKAQLHTHIRFKHKGQAFICEECGKACVSDSVLRVHLKSHTNEKNFDCQECGGKFKSAYTLKNHMTLHTGEKKFPCNMCEKKFNNASRRMEHIRRHHQSNPVECDICHRVFKVKEDYKRHRKIHYTEKNFRAKFACDHCPHRSYSKKQLEEHIAFKHRGERPFICEVCGKNTGTEKLLKLHTASMHEGKRFKCDHCSQEFKSPFGLKSHMFIHTGEKPYPCQYCNETFKDSNRRLEHIKRRHVYEPQKCDLCEKVYRLRQDLYRHKRKHHMGVVQKRKANVSKCLIVNNDVSANEDLHQRVSMQKAKMKVLMK